MRPELIDPAETPVRACASDLALVGEIAALMDSGHLFESLETALRRLREHSLAEACELFLAAPGGQEMFLVLHQGEDLDAFCHRDRFASGEGFPGIVLRAATSLVTESLQSEADFVRSRVKSLDYRSAICVPVRCGDAVGGCLLLAWKSPYADLKRLVRVAAMVSRPIGAVVELVRARIHIQELERHILRRGVEWDRWERIRDLSPVDSAAVVLFGDAPQQVLPATHGATPDGGAIGAEARCRSRSLLDRCPARSSGRIQVLGGRAGWPSHCLEAGCVAKARYCVPLSAGGAVWGIATVAFRSHAPVPLTRHLPVALWLAEELTPPDAAARNGSTVVARSSEPGRLRIRCFGGFEVLVDGRPLERSDLGREKARELLALLVAASGRPVPGKRLAEMLWPGVEPILARNRFHVTLSALRSAVEPPDGERWTHIRREGQHYYLDPRSPVFVDLWHFHALLQRATTAESEGRPGDEVSGPLEEAIALYEGDAFGGEFTDEWRGGVATRCREEVLAALGRLAELRCQARDVGGAVAALRRSEEIDPLRQDLRRRLSQILAVTARCAEAAPHGSLLEDEVALGPGAVLSPEPRRLH